MFGRDRRGIVTGYRLLSSLSVIYGVMLEFYDHSRANDRSSSHSSGSSGGRGSQANRVRKLGRFHRGEKSITPRLREFPTAMGDFSSFAIELRRVHGSGRDISVTTTRESIIRMVKIGGAGDWFSLVGGFPYRVEK